MSLTLHRSKAGVTCWNLNSQEYNKPFCVHIGKSWSYIRISVFSSVQYKSEILPAREEKTDLKIVFFPTSQTLDEASKLKLIYEKVLM